MTDESNIAVMQLEGSSKPIIDYAPRERLGILVARYRTNAGKSVKEVADHLGITEHVLTEVERHMITLNAGQLQGLAGFLVVRYEPLLDAARDWHKAIWADGGKKGGVQLATMTTETLSLRQAEHELELELIKAADELVFVSNVLRESAIKAEQAALRARELLASRGVEVPGVDPMDGPAEVECSGPGHATKRKMTRGRDFVLAYKGDGEDVPYYFCSQVCAKAWTEKTGA